jgi:hypothetical protein
LAAIVAAWIASRVPKWAEELRLASRRAEQQTDLQRIVLISLMKGRSAMLHQDTLAAINLLDVAFIDSPDVRAARLNFMQAAGSEPFSSERLVERFHALIIAVVRDMGLSAKITPADIQMGYYPRAMGRLDEAALAEAEEKIARRAGASERTD